MWVRNISWTSGNTSQMSMKIMWKQNSSKKAQLQNSTIYNTWINPEPPNWMMSDHQMSAAAKVPAGTAPKEDNVIPVVICSSEERIGATMATINSISSNTQASVFFYVVTLRDAVKLTRLVWSAVSIFTFEVWYRTSSRYQFLRCLFHSTF